MQSIDRAALKRKLDNDELQVLVEVLEPHYYANFHLPGAANVPFNELFDTEIRKAAPDKSRPVAVDCQDADCPASKEAAARLDQLGYRIVYDYEAGKTDWEAAGLPIERTPPAAA